MVHTFRLSSMERAKTLHARYSRVFTARPQKSRLDTLGSSRLTRGSRRAQPRRRACPSQRAAFFLLHASMTGTFKFAVGSVTIADKGSAEDPRCRMVIRDAPHRP
jgi:hypothetical protein